MAKKVKTRWCCECWWVGVPKHIMAEAWHMIGGFVCEATVPVEKMLCPKCKTWVNTRAAEDVRIWS